MKKILIDTDPGMDDTLAIVLAAKSSAVELLGISSVAGNYPIEVTTKNALKTLELIGRTDIPVARGMAKPLARPLAKDPFSHGSDGQAEIHLPEPVTAPAPKHGIDQIIDTVTGAPGRGDGDHARPAHQSGDGLHERAGHRPHGEGNGGHRGLLRPQQVRLRQRHRRYAAKRVERLRRPRGGESGV